MPAADVLLVSLGSTAGLRSADAALAESMRRAGASVEVAAARPVREWRTMGAIELAWALSARRAARGAGDARAVIYSTSTAALLGPRPGAIRFDAPAAGNRPGRHGLWQRPVEARRMREAPLLVPWSEGGLAEAPVPHAGAVVVPVPVAPSGPAAERDIAAITYGAHPEKKGLDRVLEAWGRARRDGEELVVAGLDEATWHGRRGAATGRHGADPWRGRRGAATGRPGADSSRARSGSPPGVRFAGMLAPAEYRALLRRARVFVTAPRREDHGIAQLEALADGCMLVTTAAPGPYAALPLARELDPRLVGESLAIRAALDEPAPGYAERAGELLRPWRPEEVDRVVADVLLPRLLD